MDKFGKLENLERNRFYRIMFLFIDLLAFEQGKLCLGVGIFVSFFWPGGRSFALKSCPGGGVLTEKISRPAVSLAGGGMVSGQIDTCIIGTHIGQNGSSPVYSFNGWLLLPAKHYFKE